MIKYEFKVNSAGISEIWYEGKKLDDIIDINLYQNGELAFAIKHGLALVTITFHAELTETK